MRKIGLTGTIGSGKSAAADILRELGACVINSDAIGHSVLLPGGSAYEPVLKAFGRGFLDGRGEINRRRLGTFVFAPGNEARLAELNAITHPLIRKEILAELEQAENSGFAVAFVESAILLDSPLADLLDEVWLVTAEESRQLQRVMERDNCTREAAEARLKKQRPAEELKARCSRVIENNGTLAELRTQLAACLIAVKEGGTC